MAYDPGAIDSTLAAAVGDEPLLIVELREAFIDGVKRGVSTMKSAESQEAWSAMLDAHTAFAKAVSDLGGTIAGGEALAPTPTATSIRNGVVTDGPFVETKELLGGYYLIEADDLDAALAIAKDVPARFGGVEVRPIMTFD